MGELGEIYLASLAGRVPGGRLTLTTGVPVTSADVTGATDVYYAPYVHDIVWLWTGTTWYPVQFSETTLALGTITSGKPYDVFGYLNAGALALEALVWTDDTTRATAVTVQGGRYCKSGDKTRLYLGTFYTTSTTTTEDSKAKRLLYNAYNGVARSMSVIDSTDTWTYTLLAYRQANNSTANQLEYMDGLGTVGVEVNVQTAHTSNGFPTAVGIGVDSTTVNSAACFGRTVGVVAFPNRAHYAGFPGVGQHALVWLEASTASGTTTWRGDNGTPTTMQTGIVGMLSGM